MRFRNREGKKRVGENNVGNVKAISPSADTKRKSINVAKWLIDDIEDFQEPSSLMLPNQLDLLYYRLYIDTNVGRDRNNRVIHFNL